MTRRLGDLPRFGAIVVTMSLVAACAGAGAAGAPGATSGPTTSPIGSGPNRTTEVASLPTPTTPPSTSAPPVLPLADVDAWIAYSIGDSSHADVRLVRSDGTDNHAIAQDSGPRSNHPEWMPDGRSLLFEQVVGRGDVKSIWSWDMTTNASKELVRCADPCVSRQGPAPSADGSQIAYETNDGPIDDVTVGTDIVPIPARCGLQVMTVATRRTEDLESGQCGLVEWRMPRWSRTGALAYFRTHQATRGGPVDKTEVVVRDVRSGKESVAYYWDGWDEANQLEWSPDAQWIVFTTQGGLRRIHPDGTGGAVLVDIGDRALHAMAYHPRFLDDGRSVTFNRSIAPRGVITSVRLYVLSIDGGATTEVLPEGPNGTALHYNWGSLQPTP